MTERPASASGDRVSFVTLFGVRFFLRWQT
jgi:hypothetical protein